MSQHGCRFCSAPLSLEFADLGVSPLANSYLQPDQLKAMEPFFPLRALVCGECWLVQLEDYESPEAIFSDYAYFSSYSTTWLEHARRYAEAITPELGLGEDSLVVEIASNDGYLLRYFQELGVPVLGVEPAANVARVALQHGVPTLVEFFGVECATGLRAESAADLIIGNNVLAHVPDVNDFVAGMKLLLKPGGTVTMEFPHLLRLIADNQFDTIYHEHFSYLSFGTVSRIFAAHGMRTVDVEELPTHGGSLRIYAAHDDDARQRSEAALELLRREEEAGMLDEALYAGFAAGLPRAKHTLLRTLLDLRAEGKRVAAYGAPAKGNTLLNYCGVGPDLIDFTVDRNPAKQGAFLPGSRIPVLAPEAIAERRPDVVFILPWNLREEIAGQLSLIREWGGRFLTSVPDVRLWD